MEILKFMNDQMKALQIPYEFEMWKSDLVYPYFVGEYSEVQPTSEDGLEESSFLITGFTRGNYIELEEIKERIKKHFHPIYGYRAQLENGSVAAFYAGADYIPTGEAELKRIQIELTIKFWKGDL